MTDNGVFPFYNAGDKACVYDCSDGNTGYYITGTSAEEYAMYGALLKKKGYSLSYENRIKDNLFQAYTNGDGMIYSYFTPWNQAVRIIHDVSSAALPQESGKYKKVTDTSLTQMALNYSSGSFGMCYIITLEDGRFVIIDGGFDSGIYGSGNVGQESRRLYQILKKFNQREDGRIVIAAWFLSHDHPDHYNVIHNFAEEFSGRVTLENFVVSIPDDMDYSAKGLYSDLKKYGSDLKLIHPHSGQILRFCNTSFEILYTHEDFYPTEDFPIDPSSINELSIVMRMAVGGQTVLFPGDMEEDASGIVCSMYGDYLKSDIMQISHHGYNLSGGTKDFYDLVDPAVILWPTSVNNYTSWRYSEVNQHVLKNLHVEEILVADRSTKRLFLPYKPGVHKIEHWRFYEEKAGAGAEKLEVEDQYSGVYYPGSLAW